MVQPGMSMPPRPGMMPAPMMGQMRGMFPFMPFTMGLGGGFRGAGYPGAGGMYSPYGGYGMMSPGSSYGGGGSYGGGSYGGGGQGSSSYAGTYQPYGADPTSLTAFGQPAPATTGPDTVLESFGVTTQGGKPAWPLGIRILAPASEARALARQVDALLEWSAAKGGGLADPNGAREAGRAVARLRVLLADQQAGMAGATYGKADRFLKRLQRAFKALERQA
jgi:hypothetical protein